LLETDDFNKRKLALSLTKYKKTTYTKEDINYLKNIKDKIPNLFPEQVKKLEQKSGLLNKVKKQWKCSCGKMNELDSNRCIKCSKDKMGFRYDELGPNEAINIINDHLEVLNNYFEVTDLVQ